jgi:hypothetical protein
MAELILPENEKEISDLREYAQPKREMHHFFVRSYNQVFPRCLHRLELIDSKRRYDKMKDERAYIKKS